MLPIINFYASAFDNKVEQIEVESGIAIKNVKELAKVDFKNTVIFVNGHQADETVILKDGDICTLREFPRGTGTGEIISGLILLPAMPTLGTYLFVDGIVDSATDGHGSLRYFIDQLRPKMATQDQIQQIPTIQGGKNQSGANQPVPLIIGETYYTPLYVGTPYTTIDPSKHNDGEDEYFTGLYCLGQSDIEVKDFNLGIYSIASNSENTKNGFINIDGFYKESEYSTQLEIKDGSTSDDEVSLYSQKVVQESLNAELMFPDNDEDRALVARPFSAIYAEKVRLEIMFNSLLSYNKDDGSEETTSVDIGFAYSTNGGASYKALIQDGNWGNSDEVTIKENGTKTYTSDEGIKTTYQIYRFTAKKNKQMRFALDKTFAWAELQETMTKGLSAVEFAVRRITADSTDTKVQDKCYFTRITSWCYDYSLSKSAGKAMPQRPIAERFRKLTTRVGFKIKTGTNVNGTLDEFNCIVSARGQTIVNGVWTTTTSVTSNPASMAIMCMKSPLRGKYAYKDNQIDWVSFGRLYHRCAEPDTYIDGEPRYVVNGVINSQRKTSEVLQSILNTANAYLVLKGTTYGVFVDEPQENPVMVLNNQNVLEASNSKSFDEPTHAIKAKFVNKHNYYKSDSYLCTPNKYNGIPQSEMNITESEFYFYTDPKRVYRKAMRMIAEKELRPETWTRKVAIEGNLIEIGNLVELQDDTISVGIGNGAEITEVVYDSNQNITGIKTDGTFTVSVKDNHGIKITQADGIHQPVVKTYKVKESNVGEYSDFTFETPISADTVEKPCVGDIVTFGVYNKETAYALCFGKKDNGDGTFTLNFVPYQEGVYTSETGDIPAFVSNVTAPIQNGVLVTDDKQNLTIQDVINIKLDGQDGYSLFIENNTYVVTADSDGNIEEDVEVRATVHFLKGTEEQWFDYGTITPPSGMTVYKDNKDLVFTFKSGTELPMNGSVEIPIKVAGKVEDVRFILNNETDSDLVYLGVGQDYLGYHVQQDYKVFSLYFSYAKSLEGKKGKDGKGLNQVIEFYCTSMDSKNAPASGWTMNVKNVSKTGMYLWNFERVMYSNGESYDTAPQMIGTYGNGLEKITEYYAISSSNTTAPTEGWSTTVPTVTDSQPYLWNYEEMTYTDGTTTTTPPTWLNGIPGKDGKDGQSVRGGRYLGTYDKDSSISGMVADDFYLNTTTGYIRYYDGKAWNDVKSSADSRYQQAIGDIEAILKSIPEGTPAKTAGTAFIKVLFANEINIMDGGFIKSGIYDNTTGFKIKSDGSAVFNNVTVNGKYGANGINIIPYCACVITTTVSAARPVDRTGLDYITVEQCSCPYHGSGTNVVNLVPKNNYVINKAMQLQINFQIEGEANSYKAYSEGALFWKTDIYAYEYETLSTFVDITPLMANEELEGIQLILKKGSAGRKISIYIQLLMY